jgi:hypothetical protein
MRMGCGRWRRWGVWVAGMVVMVGAVVRVDRVLLAVVVWEEV